MQMGVETCEPKQLNRFPTDQSNITIPPIDQRSLLHNFKNRGGLGTMSSRAKVVGGRETFRLSGGAEIGSSPPWAVFVRVGGCEF